MAMPVKQAAVDIIVPLYNNFVDAQNLFDALRAAKNERYANVIVIDDASDETMPQPTLVADGSLLQVTWVKNTQNRGFAASVNQGMRVSCRDVVLLNSDTLVFDGWLDRMCDIAASDPRIGTVTPLSNAATIFSYPFAPEGYRATLETSWSRLDELCAEVGGKPVATPTAVGFCMLIKRACLDQIGLFDEITFRAGYGEENDFCQRAGAAGWSHVAASNVFVWHRDEGSFAKYAATLRAEAERQLRLMHPHYSASVAAHIRRDPLRPLRRQLDLARIRADGRPLHLFMADPPRATTNSKPLAMSWQRVSGRIGVYRPTIVGFAPLPNLSCLTILTSRSLVSAMLIEYAIVKVVVTRNTFLPRLLANRIISSARTLGLPVVDEFDGGVM